MLDQLDTVYVEANNTVGTAAHEPASFSEADTVDSDARVHSNAGGIGRAGRLVDNAVGFRAERPARAVDAQRGERLERRTGRRGRGCYCWRRHGPQVGVGNRQEIQLVLELAIALAQSFYFGFGIERSSLPVRVRLSGHELASCCAAELIYTSLQRAGLAEAVCSVIDANLPCARTRQLVSDR